MAKIYLQYSEHKPKFELSIEELNQQLDKLINEANLGTPIIIFVYAHGYQISVGLSNQESFLQFGNDSGNPPYLISTGDKKAIGAMDFYLFGTHHTEVRKKFLIPNHLTLKILNQWLLEEKISQEIDWEEI